MDHPSIRATSPCWLWRTCVLRDDKNFDSRMSTRRWTIFFLASWFSRATNIVFFSPLWLCTDGNGTTLVSNVFHHSFCTYRPCAISPRLSNAFYQLNSMAKERETVPHGSVGLWGTPILPLEELLKRSPVGESGTPDANVLFQTEVFHLMFDSRLFPIVRSLSFVRFDAPIFFFIFFLEIREVSICVSGWLPF